MKKQILKNYFSFCLGLFIVTTLASCYTPTEGCLNPAATNFDVTVDDPCDDCCTFPNLILQFRHSYNTLVDSTSVTRDSTLNDDFGNPYSIDDFQFFIQDVVLIGDNGNLEVLDTIELNQNGILDFVKDDMALVKLATTSYILGTFDKIDSYHTLTFQIGLDISNLDFSNLSELNLLSENSDSLYFVDRFASFQAKIVRDTMAKEISKLSKLDQLYSLSFMGDFSSLLGQNLTIPLVIDYKKWFAGVDIVNDSDQIILDKLSDNTPVAFGL